MINETKGSQYYGCSCQEIGTVPKECPPDQCVGDNWVDYPIGEKQECKDGKLLSFTCKPISRSYDDTCKEKNLARGSGTGEWNSNTNSWNSNTNAWAQSPYNNSPTGKTTSPTTGASNTGNKGGAAGSKDSGQGKKIKDNFGDWQGDRRNPVPDTNDWGKSYAGPEGVKQALKRMFERDRLRYLQIFKYTTQIHNQGGGGGMSAAGLTWACGHYSVTFGTGVRMLDRIIMHENTHSADFCQRTIGNIPSAEYVAVGEEVGSVGRINESPGQKEGIKVANTQLNGGKSGEERPEVRGYGSRLLNIDIDPPGDMNQSMIGSDINYAKGYKSSNGNWVYGWPPGGDHYTLRLNDDEDQRVKRIVEWMNKRKCMTRPPADLPQLTVENGYQEEYLEGCKPTDTSTREIKIGN
jgi:hypothetical protein